MNVKLIVPAAKNAIVYNITNRNPVYTRQAYIVQCTHVK